VQPGTADGVPVSTDATGHARPNLPRKAPAIPAANAMPATEPGLRGVMGAERLRRLLAAGRGAHAYLIVGPDGSGRRTAALALGSALLCQSPDPQHDACGACASCGALSTGSHPDLHVLAGHRLEDAKTLTHAAALRPHHGGRAVFVLPDADGITPEAVAVLLKPIEEPAPGTTFILTALSPDHVPETIVSRCQVVPMLPVPGPDLVDWLKARGVAPQLAPDLAEAAGGRPGQAVQLSQDPEWRARCDAAAHWVAGAGARTLGEALGQAAAAAEATDLGEVLAALRAEAASAAMAGDWDGVERAARGFDAAVAAAAALESHVGARLTWEVLAVRLRGLSRVRYNRPKR